MRVFLERDLVLVSSLGQLWPRSLKPGTILRSLKCNPCSWKTRRAGAWRMPEKAWVTCGSRVQVAMLGSTCHPRLFLETRGSEGFPCTRDRLVKERERERFWIHSKSCFRGHLSEHEKSPTTRISGNRNCVTFEGSTWAPHGGHSWGSPLKVPQSGLWKRPSLYQPEKACSTAHVLTYPLFSHPPLKAYAQKGLETAYQVGWGIKSRKAGWEAGPRWSREDMIVTQV